MTLVALTALADVPAGGIKLCGGPDGEPLAVYNVDGAIFVTEDTCTHGMASLSEGTLDGFRVECPFHGGVFDVRTGQALEYPCSEAIRSFPAVLENGLICIDV